MAEGIVLTDTKVASIKPPVAGQDEHKDGGPGYVRGLRLRVGTSGRKVWIVRARAGKEVINRKLGVYPAMGLRDARKAAEKLLQDIAKGGSAEAADRTFGAAAEAWITKKRADTKRNKSVDLQERQLKRHVLSKWSGRKLVEIRRSDVRDLIEGIEGDVLPNRVLAAVRTVFAYAVDREWVESSPAWRLKPPKDETERDRVLNMDEAKRVWDASGLLGYPNGPYVRALLLTGQRRTEVASMKWVDLDLDDATWLLKAGDTKAARAHVVPLSPPMVELLKAQPQWGPFVFTTDGESHIGGYGKLKARLDTFLSASGDPLEAWRLHDLRRTVATHMVRLGVPVETVGRILNHALVGVTRKVYARHDFAVEKRSALDRWAAELMRFVEGEAAKKVVPIRG